MKQERTDIKDTQDIKDIARQNKKIKIKGVNDNQTKKTKQE